MNTIKNIMLIVCAQIVLLCSVGAVSAEVLSTIFYHNDALGSPVAATDEQGNVKWRENYHPYGDKVNNDIAAEDNSRWYTSHPHDEETGLTYAGARYYDPVVGRFMGIDPVGFNEGNIHSFNWYAYVSNNPYKYIDPDGRVVVISEKMQPAVDNLKAGSKRARSILSRLDKDSRIFKIRTSSDPSGGTANELPGKQAKLWRKSLLGEEDEPDGFLITVNLNPESHKNFTDADGNPFTSSVERILSHELGHALIWANSGSLTMGINQSGAVDTENEIAREINPKSTIRHRTEGHGSSFKP